MSEFPQSLVNSLNLALYKHATKELLPIKVLVLLLLCVLTVLPTPEHVCKQVPVEKKNTTLSCQTFAFSVLFSFVHLPHLMLLWSFIWPTGTPLSCSHLFLSLSFPLQYSGVLLQFSRSHSPNFPSFSSPLLSNLHTRLLTSFPFYGFHVCLLLCICSLYTQTYMFWVKPYEHLKILNWFWFNSLFFVTLSSQERFVCYTFTLTLLPFLFWPELLATT